MKIIKIDLNNDQINTHLPAKQGDIGRKFQIHLFDSDVPFPVPQNAVISVWYSGCSGEGSYSKIDGKSAFVVKDHTVTIEMTPQMLTNSGAGILCLILNNQDGTQIGLWNIPYIVEKIVGSANAPAQDHYSLFSELAIALEKIKEKLSLSGGTMSGSIAMGGNRISNLGVPQDSDEAATLGTVTQAVAEEKAQRLQEIATERARINALATMPAGSTSADAEVLDIRVGSDGKTYSSAGAAVREQIDRLGRENSAYAIGSINLFNPDTVSESYQWISTSTGQLVAQPSWNVCASDFIEIHCTVICVQYQTPSFSGTVCFYDQSRSYMGCINGGNASVSNVESRYFVIPVMPGARYIRLNIYPATKVKTAMVCPYIYPAAGEYVPYLHTFLKKPNAIYDPTVLLPGSSDSTVQIMEKLERYGECRLLGGDYYAKTITMPKNSRIYGAGNATVLHLLDSVQNGALLDCAGGNTIENLSLQGGITARPNADSFDSTRYGIRISEASSPVKISKLTVEGFSGAGIYVYNTGYTLLNSVILSDSLFRYNRAGLEMGKYGEYAAVTGCSFRSNYYGAVNHGGNNRFSACGFDGNEYGFFAKNGYPENSSSLMYPNNGHGSCVGCSFNHNTNAIYLEYITFGFVFSGCQIFDGRVSAKLCCGINFIGCQMGGIPMNFSYGGTHHISNCVFLSVPSIEIKKDTNSKRTVAMIRDCYTQLGEPVKLTQ